MRIIDILKEEAVNAGLAPEQLIAKNKNEDICSVRDRVFWRCRLELNKRYSDISKIMKRHPSSIYDGVMRYARRNNLPTTFYPEKPDVTEAEYRAALIALGFSWEPKRLKHAIHAAFKVREQANGGN
jgi:transposase